MSDAETPKPFSQEALDLEPGVYEHYKGGRYKVLDIGRNERDEEEVVIYQALSEGNDIWVRPLSDFLEIVSFEGKEVPRFTFAMGE